MSNKLRYPSDWIKKKESNQKISVITCYDASSAALVEHSNIDSILVGDSLGMVVQGHSSTVPVRLEDMILHGQYVRRGAPNSFVIVDLPFGSYHSSIESGVQNGLSLLQSTNAQSVKLEGAEDDTLKIIYKLTSAGAPVMGHIGFTPQSFLSLGGFRIQGRGDLAASHLLKQAIRLQEAGCYAIVLELMPSQVAETISKEIKIPTIGIGAGVGCDGQVQVFHDLLGLLSDFSPKHARKFDTTAERWISAFNQYHADVVEGRFPGSENSHS
ncbi:MAG: 3-methyl-2-oxobutanoate hydroxymethyltransferase [Leptonema sp. (in: Bacteria)]|nr:3-methyl-2-oxobutanoate hydroxymethyltransferase [Leptonema sp. (in: bacteria)]